MARPLRFPPSAALEAMLLADQARGVEVLNDAPRPPGPVEKSAPMVRPGIPPANWRAELQERAEREAREKARQAQDELEPPTPTYPASKGGA